MLRICEDDCQEAGVDLGKGGKYTTIYSRFYSSIHIRTNGTAGTPFPCLARSYKALS